MKADLKRNMPLISSEAALLILLVLSLAVIGLGALNQPAVLLIFAAIPLAAVAIVIFWRALLGDRAMIITVLFISIFVLDAVFRVRSYEDKSIDFQIVLKAATWAALFAIALTRMGTALHKMFSGIGLFWTLFFFWIATTTLYAPNTLYSLVATFSVLSFFVFFAAMEKHIGFDRIMIVILMAILMMAIGSLLVYFAVPSLGRTKVWIGNVLTISNRLAGLAGNANSIGRMCCLGLIITVIYWQQLRQTGRYLPHMAFLLLAVVLLASNSRTSLVVTAIILLAHAASDRRNFQMMSLFIILSFLALLMLLPFSEEIMIGLSRSGRADELATGTSRTLIWNVVSILGWQKPLLGWGYGSTVFLMPKYEHLMGHAAPHAHNLVLQLWLTTGLVGVGLFFLAFVTRLIAAYANGEKPVVALLLFVVLNGVLESSAFSGVANISTVALVLAAVASPTNRQKNNNNSNEKALMPLEGRHETWPGSMRANTRGFLMGQHDGHGSRLYANLSDKPRN